MGCTEIEERTVKRETLEPAVSGKRRRGRPSLGPAPMPQSERNRRWRGKQAIVDIEVPALVADRFRRVREQRGLSNADLIAAALDALETTHGKPLNQHG